VVAETTLGPYLHALDITSGAEKLGGPALVDGSVTGAGSDSNGGTINLEGGCYQRNALALNPVSNLIYPGFGHCNHGWLFAYGKTSLPQKAIFNDTPDGAGGGLWNSGGAAAIDDQSGEVYIMTGIDAGDPPSGYNDSFLPMSADNLSVEDFFQPDDESFLASAPNQSHSAPVQASAEARIAASSGGVERVAVRPSRTTIRGSCLIIAA
jgi:hypothetical protein